MFCQKGDLLQSHYSGRVFLVLEENVQFKPEIEYTLHLFTMSPYPDGVLRRFKIVMGIDKIHRYNVNKINEEYVQDYTKMAFEATLQPFAIDTIEFGPDFMGYY